jgi:hypothetical protein
MIRRLDEVGTAGSRRLAKIAELEAKLGQLKERQQAVEARRRALKSRRERKADTRRKILVGAIVLAKVEHGEMDRALLGRWLEQGLVRDDDRALFGLVAR